jgi:uncharacterized metal-binding protein YceD (DUF177 family)
MEKTGSLSSVASTVPWSVPVAVDDIPQTGLHIAIDAPAETRAQLLRLVAGLSTVRALASLSAVFDLTRRGARVHVTGHVRARVGQICVVTLEPIDNDVDETVDLLFAPTPAEAEATGREIEVKLDQEPPEPLTSGTMDLGALATEFLVLGIDPYPRKPGAEFFPLKVGDDGPRHFAALEALKKRLGGGQS